MTNNERARETGLPATEAMLDVLPMEYAIHAAHSSPTYTQNSKNT